MLTLPGTDKILHLFVSYLIARSSPLVAILAGIGKEVYDESIGKVVDGADLIADGIGIFLALLDL